jgi:hypothetical protein
MRWTKRSASFEHRNVEATMVGRELPDWNAVRHDAASRAGHVESYFIKANSPDGKRALWLKATIFATHARPSHAVAEAWAVYFERDGQHVAVKRSMPYAEAAFSRDGLKIAIGEHLKIEPEAVRGAIEYGGHEVSFALRAQGDEPPIVMFPSSAMYAGRFPRQKLVTPRPDLTFDGSLTVDGKPVLIEGWRGMQGHNWGLGHAEFYAWGHCNLWEREEALIVEATTARLKVGPLQTPMITLVCVRHGGRSYDLNGAWSMARNRGEVDGRRWHFEAQDRGVRVEGDVSGQASDFVGLYYPNPDGRMTYCLNTKLAMARVRLEVPGQKPKDWIARAAAFEIGTREPDHGIRMYV